MTWWRRLFRRRKQKEELEKELRFNLDQYTADLIAQGLDPEEARRQARLALGGPEQVKEKLRDVRGTRWLGDLLQDLRYAGRMWRQSPGFTLFAVCGLALAIGANTFVFTIVNAALYRTPSTPGIDRLGVISGIDMAHSAEEPLDTLSYPDYLDFKKRLKSFEDIAAVQFRNVDLSDEANFPERRFAARMTANTLSVLGGKLALGRNLELADTQPGAPPVALLAYRVWESRYNKNESVIGKTVRIDGVPYNIIGVTAPGVRLALNIDLWIPYITPQTPSRGDRGVDGGGGVVFGRLADGVSISQANAEAGAIARQLAAEFPSTNKDIGAMVQNFNEALIRVQIRRVLQALLGGVAFVLLIACANVANLLLGRAVIRSREMSIRAALGAGRWRVIRQLLTESVLLSIMAGVLGAFLAYWGMRAFDAALSAMEFDRADYMVFSVDRNALLYLAAISIGTGIVFGLAPALRMSRIDLSGALKEGGQGAGAGVRRRLLTNILVGAEVALSVVLLMGAGLMIRSMINVGNVNLGVNTENVMTMAVNLPRVKYKEPQQQASFFQELIARINALP